MITEMDKVETDGKQWQPMNPSPSDVHLSHACCKFFIHLVSSKSHEAGEVEVIVAVNHGLQL
jgi:hypothetical protein